MKPIPESVAQRYADFQRMWPDAWNDRPDRRDAFFEGYGVELTSEDETRHALLTAALEEFANHGYSDASTNAIVKRLGIAKGSLFKYFETRAELLTAVFRHASERIGLIVGVGPGKRWFRSPEATEDDPSDPAWRDAYLAEVDAYVQLILHGGTHE